MLPTEWAIEFKEFKRLYGFTSVGCYPIVYCAPTGATLCADCVTRDIREGLYGPYGRRAKDLATMRGIYWEGEPLNCDECNTPIESAYGPVKGE